MHKILIIDNYDSFTYNLEQLFGTGYDGRLMVKRNDEIDFDFIEAQNFEGIVISPGPKTPGDVPFTISIIERYYRNLPIMGICLGMQCINELFGGKTVLAPYPMHGKIGRINHTNEGIFKEIPQDTVVARYHSLISEVKSDELEITAKLADGITMGIRHKHYPLCGVQFHPESFLTEHGKEMIINFLDMIKERR